MQSHGLGRSSKDFLQLWAGFHVSGMSLAKQQNNLQFLFNLFINIYLFIINIVCSFVYLFSFSAYIVNFSDHLYARGTKEEAKT